jgi:hypothetical protein
MPFRLYKIAIITIILFFINPSHVFASTNIIKAEAQYQFGKNIEFLLQLRSSEKINSGMVFFGETGVSSTQVGELKVVSKNDGFFLLEGKFDLPDLPIRSNAIIDYYFKVTLANETVFQTQNFSIDYLDNRFTWQSMQAGDINIHWYQGDEVMAQKIVDTSEASIQRIQELIPLSSPQKTDIYVYQSIEEMGDAIGGNSLNWVAGHSEPDLGVVFVAIPPGPDQDMFIEQRIPHELMHIFLGYTIGKTPTGLPTWFEEGLASTTELYPNPDYAYILENARKSGAILTMDSLCQAFPRDASNAYLAYAQSSSFVRYLHIRFGSSGLLKLLAAYKDGLDCDYGIQNALGNDLLQLEHQWRKEVLGENIFFSTLKPLSPWLFLLFVVLAVPLLLTIIYIKKK